MLEALVARYAAAAATEAARAEGHREAAAFARLAADGSTPLELGEALLISARMRTLRATPWPCAYSTLCAQDVLQARFGAAATSSRRALELAPRLGATDVVATRCDTGGWPRRRWLTLGRG